MTKPETTRTGLIAMTLLGLVLTLALPCHAQSEEDKEATKLLTEAQKSFREGVTPFMKSYCIECHSSRRTKGGINFDPALKSPGEASASRKWMQALANVRTHDMPPESADDQPTEKERDKFINAIDKLKYLSPKDPGPFVIRRLTKVEYGNTLHDLVGVDPSVAQELPDDVAGEGYLNSLSPLQSEQYLSIANEVVNRVIAPKGKPPTEVQKRLFGESPASGTDLRAAAKTVASKLARTAYRRPPSESEVETLLKVFDLARANKLDYTKSLGLMLKAVLVSPEFLFITPAHEAEAGKKIVPLDDHQLASRLSYLLWATMPDAELSALADEGKLHEPAVLKAQAKRLLMDKRSHAPCSMASVLSGSALAASIRRPSTPPSSLR